MMPAKWEVWLVDMPFEEGINSKIRPALVIDPQQNFIVVGKMTSHPPRENFQDEYQMIDWEGAGLIKETTLRLSHLVRLNPSSFIICLGKVQPEDQIKIRKILEKKEINI